MNENARKWVEALRSGEFDQTDGRLRNNGCYCCLGVACELYRRDTGKGRWTKDESFQNGNQVMSDLLPPIVQRWLGLGTESGEFRNQFGRDSLVNQNDCGSSFDEIADTIEAEPAGLFA